MDSRILAIDDEMHFLDSIRRGLVTAGYKNIFFLNHPEQVQEFIEKQPIDLAIIDITMPKISGLEVLELIKTYSPETECIMVTAVEEIETAVRAMRLGAYDYLIKPLSREKLLISLDRALERKRLIGLLAFQRNEVGLQVPPGFQGIVTVSRPLLKVLHEADLHARSDIPVLITGESGTGKELLAQAIHRASNRSGKPFIPVNMAALSPSLFESEFFGHIRGAFTGADRDREGYLEAAAGGTLFLDEIGDLSPDLQGKLLRVLQEKEFVKLGTTRTRKIEVRFVAATNANLEQLVSRGRFRKDLYYRLKVAWLNIPPLRERLDDVPALVEHFLQEFGFGQSSAQIQEEALALLQAYSYPGNVRELRSIIQSAYNLAQGGLISISHLPLEMRKIKAARLAVVAPSEPGEENLSLAEVEKGHILKVYKQTGQNKTQTAKLLDIGLTTLHRKLKEFGIK